MDSLKGVPKPPPMKKAERAAKLSAEVKDAVAAHQNVRGERAALGNFRATNCGRDAPAVCKRGIDTSLSKFRKGDAHLFDLVGRRRACGVPGKSALAGLGNSFDQEHNMLSPPTLE